MKQRIERVAFEAPNLQDLMVDLNTYTSKISVGNIMDTTIEPRLQTVDITKKTESLGTQRESEYYTYMYTAVVTVLVEE